MLVQVNSSCVGIKEQIKTYDHSGLAVIAPTLVVPPPGTKATGESSPGKLYLERRYHRMVAVSKG